MAAEPYFATDGDLSAVGGTALIVANCRARLSRLKHRWFADPLALHLAATHPDWDEWTLDRGLLAWIAVRTRFLDELILQSVSEGVTQVVILGAGLDARAFRLDLPPTITLFEIDRADVLDIKASAISGADLTPFCHREVVTTDLSDETWPTALAAAGWQRTARTVWIAEGLLIFFEQSQRAELLSTLCTLVTADDVLGATMTMRRPDQPLWRPLSDQDQPSWFGDCGWTAQVRTMAEVRSDYGRPISCAGRGQAQLIRAVPASRGEPS